MNAPEPVVHAALLALDASAAAGDMLLPAYAAMDDATLLAHFRAPRRVEYFSVADADETEPAKIDAIVGGRFSFNGETHALSASPGAPVDWLANPSRDVEWHILLHKFYYATGLGLRFADTGDVRYAQRWRSLIDSWIAQVPVGFIAADVTGRRVQNWIYSYRHFITHPAHPLPAAVDGAFHRRLLHSLHAQVEFLCANLTPARNHRTLELTAIFLAGVVFPEFRAAARWRAFALDALTRNLADDLLADGVHCELSTDYHHLVVKNALNVRRLASGNRIAVPAAFDEAVQRALEFSLHVHQPDGSVPSFSDGDVRGWLDLLAEGARIFGRDDFRWVASGGREGQPPLARVAHFPDSGYAIVRSHWGNGGGSGGGSDNTPFADAQHLVFDCGPLGAGNHGHFDCLSFELAAHGRALVVDPARYTYSEAVGTDGTNWRVRFRGTAAHNTVCVDGRNQTRYEPKAVKDKSRHAEGSVRHKVSGPAPDATLIECVASPMVDLLRGEAASHEYDAVHQRALVLVDRRYWIVCDSLCAPSAHEYALHFQLSEAADGLVRLRQSADGLCADTPGLLLAQPAERAVLPAVEPSWVSQRYGHKRAAPRLRFVRRGTDALFDTVLLPHRAHGAVLSVQRQLLLRADGTVSPHARALRIRGRADGAGFDDLWLETAEPPGAASTWVCGALRFRGRWALVRHDARGAVIGAYSHRGARLTSGDALITLATLGD